MTRRCKSNPRQKTYLSYAQFITRDTSPYLRKTTTGCITSWWSFFFLRVVSSCHLRKLYQGIDLAAAIRCGFILQTGIYSASLGQFFTHSKQRIHSVPFFRFLELSVTSTSIGHTFLHLPHETHLLLSHLIRSSEK